ncbi:MAG: glycosyltransferase family 39 protein [Acidobacteriota bacterium]|nr:glycosyltransferase family 39 protein [Acidobacteriota bacterium]
MGQQRHLIAFVLLACYLTLFFQLGDLPFMGADEPRYARISEEMLLGADFVTPRLEGAPWLEKPPLLFWVQALSFHFFGVSEAAARLPVALLGLLCALAAGGLAWHVAGFRAGVLSILILSTSTLFFIFARAGSTDMPLTACLTVALVCGYRATGSRNLIWSLLSGTALGAAALAKGPIALILFGGIFTVYFLWIEKLGWHWRHLLAGTAAFLATSVPWYWSVWAENGYSFFVTFWLNHHLARVMSDLHHHSQPFWYYLVVLAVGFFPWTPFLAGSFARLWRSRTGAGPDHSQVFLWIWAALPVVFFSLSESKLPGYILPVVPALALLVAREWDRDPAGETAPARSLRIQWLVLQGLALLMAAAIVYMSRTFYDSASGLWVALPLAAAILWGTRESRAGRPERAFLSLVGGMVLAAAAAFSFLGPVVENYHSARSLARASQPMISEDRPLVLYRYFHHTALYYTGYQATREEVPSLAHLRHYSSQHPQADYYLLTKESGWRDLAVLEGSRSLLKEGNLRLVRLPGESLNQEPPGSPATEGER